MSQKKCLEFIFFFIFLSKKINFIMALSIFVKNGIQTYHNMLDGVTEYIRYVLSNGGNPNERCEDGGNYHGKTALAIALEKGDLKLMHLLLKRGANPCLPEPSGNGSLYLAAKGGHYEAVELLLKWGVWPDRKNAHMKTPLCAAMRYERPQIVRLLLDHGARPPVEDPGESWFPSCDTTSRRIREIVGRYPKVPTLHTMCVMVIKRVNCEDWSKGKEFTFDTSWIPPLLLVIPDEFERERCKRLREEGDDRKNKRQRI